MSHPRYQLAIKALQTGRLIAYPTEAVWGLGCDPLNASAVNGLLEIKQRPVHKGLILVADKFLALKPYVSDIPEYIMSKVKQSWPGPVTWILPAKESTPEWLTGNHAGIAVRVSSHPVVKELCEGFQGAIVSTSANPAGMPPAKNELTVKHYFGNRIDFIVKGAIGDQKQPSSIINAMTGEIIRD